MVLPAELSDDYRFVSHSHVSAEGALFEVEEKRNDRVGGRTDHRRSRHGQHTVCGFERIRHP